MTNTYYLDNNFINLQKNATNIQFSVISKNNHIYSLLLDQTNIFQNMGVDKYYNFICNCFESKDTYSYNIIENETLCIAFKLDHQIVPLNCEISLAKTTNDNLRQQFEFFKLGVQMNELKNIIKMKPDIQHHTEIKNETKYDIKIDHYYIIISFLLQLLFYKLFL